MSGKPKPRPLITQPDDRTIRLVPLTKGLVVIVDADRYEWVMQWNWHVAYNRFGNYAGRRGRDGEPDLVLLHRQLAGEPFGEVDHVNGDRLDCRIQNLRACTQGQNRMNREPRSDNKSGHAGVCRVGNKWRPRIQINGKETSLGLCDTKEQAIARRVYAELVHYGEFAYSARDLVVLPPGLFPLPD
jgi:HNH endonuclease